jgi:hypothetical protein
MIATQPIGTDMGLNLVDPISALEPGALVRAQNLRADAWGPRHGHTYIDRATRSRTHPTLNGTTAYGTLPYIEKQFDLGTKFTLDILLKVGALPTVNAAWVFGTDAAVDRTLDVFLNTDGTIDVYLEDASANSVLLSSTTVLAATDVVHIRVLREKAVVELYLDTSLEDTDSANLSATARMAAVAADRLIGKTSLSSPSSELLNGRVCGVYLRSFADEDFTYAYSELPCPRGSEVLGAWTCELLDSDTTIFDASTFGNHGIMTNAGSGARVAEIVEPIQAVRAMTLRDGKRYNLVLVGGRLYVENV